MNKNETGEQSILENLSFTLSAMCSLVTSRSRPLQAGFLLATETDAASENWAFLPSRTVEKAQVREACSFFGELPFVWPVFPGADPSYRRTLEDEGLLLRGELVAMRGTSLNNHGKRENADFTFTKITTGEGAVVWAETAWRSFDSPP